MQTYCKPWVPGIDVFLADHLGHFRDECCRITGRCCDHLQVPSIAPDPYISPCRSLILSILIPVTASYTLEYIDSTRSSTRLFPSVLRNPKPSKAMKAAKEDPWNPSVVTWLHLSFWRTLQLWPHRRLAGSDHPGLQRVCVWFPSLSETRQFPMKIAPIPSGNWT